MQPFLYQLSDSQELALLPSNVYQALVDIRPSSIISSHCNKYRIAQHTFSQLSHLKAYTRNGRIEGRASVSCSDSQRDLHGVKFGESQVLFRFMVCVHGTFRKQSPPIRKLAVLTERL